MNLWKTYAKHAKVDLDVRTEKLKQDNKKLEDHIDKEEKILSDVERAI